MNSEKENKNRLIDLKRGERAVIISNRSCGEVRRRLMDMGVVKGAEFEVIRKAPLGDPIEIRMNGFLLSLRLEEAENIFVAKI